MMKKAIVGCMGAGAAGFCTIRYFRCTTHCILVPAANVSCGTFFLASADHKEHTCMLTMLMMFMQVKFTGW
jgi:hypothetical protein